MNLSRLKNYTGLGLSAFCIITTTVHAGIPLWSFSPNGSPIVTVSATGTATASYTLTNNSKKPHRLVLSSKTPPGISQSGGPCVLAAKSPANPNPTCTLALSITGSALSANTVSGGPVLCQDNGSSSNSNQCYQPSPGDTLVITRTTTSNTTTLSTSIPSPSILALSVNDSSKPALTGNARQITITNTGIIEARGLSIAYPAWPGGTPATTATSTCGATLAAGAACTITVTPGVNATSSCNTGIAPTPDTITVSATNVATAVPSNVVVLSYGCQYQGGFLYSVDDTTNNGVTGTCSSPPCTGGIGGKVVSLVDQAEPFIIAGPQATSIIWSSNGSASTDVSYDIIPGTDETSITSNESPGYAAFSGTFGYPGVSGATYTNTAPSPALGFIACNGSNDGSCDTSNILLFYNQYQTNYSAICDPQSGGSGGCTATMTTSPATPSDDYAAGLCTATIDTYSDWYLPAICEMDAVYGSLTCPAGVQSMIVNLSFLRGDPGSTTPPPSTSCTPPSGTDCLAGDYWSSTGLSFTPQTIAWSEHFASGGSSRQNATNKHSQLGVRCSRALTF